jgi:ferredoxin
MRIRSSAAQDRLTVRIDAHLAAKARPAPSRQATDRRRRRKEATMAFVIAEPCVDHMDRACVDVCPVDCIAGDPDLDRKFYIDPDGCIDCGSCESACPNGAIFAADRLPAAWALYGRVDAVWFGDPERARAAVEALADAAA